MSKPSYRHVALFIALSLTGCNFVETIQVRSTAGSGSISEDERIKAELGRIMPIIRPAEPGAGDSFDRGHPLLPEEPITPPHLRPMGTAERVGLNIHGLEPGPRGDRMIQRLKEANVQWVRIDANWHYIEAAHGNLDDYGNAPYGFKGTGLDQTVDRLHAAGIGIFMSLAYTPYSLWGKKDGNGKPRFGGSAPPTDVSHWERFVTASVQRYGEKVKYFGIWNEPNVGGFFNGTGAEYDELFRLAYTAAKRVRSDVKIVGPDLAMGSAPADTPENVGWEQWLMDRLDNARSAGTPMEVITVHFYNPADAIHNAVSDLRKKLRARGYDQPLWLTEAGDGDFTIFHSYESQERHYARLLEINKTTQAWDKLFYFRLQGVDFGITDDDHLPKPAFNALKFINQRYSTYQSCPSGSCTDVEGNCCSLACGQSTVDFSCQKERQRLYSQLKAREPGLKVTASVGGVGDQSYRDTFYAGYRGDKVELDHNVHGRVARNFLGFRLEISPRFHFFTPRRHELSLEYRVKLKGQDFPLLWTSEGQFAGFANYKDAIDQLQIRPVGTRGHYYDVKYQCFYESNPLAPPGQLKGTEASPIVKNGDTCGKAGHEVRGIKVWIERAW